MRSHRANGSRKRVPRFSPEPSYTLEPCSAGLTYLVLLICSACASVAFSLVVMGHGEPAKDFGGTPRSLKYQIPCKQCRHGCAPRGRPCEVPMVPMQWPPMKIIRIIVKRGARTGKNRNSLAQRGSRLMRPEHRETLKPQIRIMNVQTPRPSSMQAHTIPLFWATLWLVLGSQNYSPKKCTIWALTPENPPKRVWYGP